MNKAAFAVLLFLYACRNEPPARLIAWLDAWEEARACLVAVPEIANSDRADEIGRLTQADCSMATNRLWLASNDDLEGVPGWRRASIEISAGPNLSRIGDIDRQIAELREYAGLSEIRREEPRQVLQLGAGSPLVVAGKPVLRGRAQLSFQAGAIRGRVTSAEGESVTHFEISEQGTFETTLPATDYVLAYPSRKWGAVVANGGLSIAEHGRVTEVLKLKGVHQVAKAMDAGAARAVFLERFGARDDHDFSFQVAVTDDGKRWRLHTAAQHLPLRDSSQDPRTGGVELIARSVAYDYIYRFDQIQPFVFPKGRIEDRDEGWARCRDGETTWTEQRWRWTRSDATGSTTLDRPLDIVTQVDCRGSSAIMLGVTTLSRCKGSTCERVLEIPPRIQGAATNRIAMVDDERWVFAATENFIVAITDDRQTTTFRLGEGQQVVGIGAVAGTLQLVTADSQDRLRLVKVPKSSVSASSSAARARAR